MNLKGALCVMTMFFMCVLCLELFMPMAQQSVAFSNIYAPTQTAQPAQQQPPVELQILVFGPTPDLAVEIQTTTGVLKTTLHLGDKQETVCTLTAGDYLAKFGDKVTAFTVENNASITNVAGHGWTDGEALHLTEIIPCTLTILRPQTEENGQVFTLVGASEPIKQVVAGSETQVVFPGLVPGNYSLQLPSGETRDIVLDRHSPALTIEIL